MRTLTIYFLSTLNVFFFFFSFCSDCSEKTIKNDNESYIIYLFIFCSKKFFVFFFCSDRSENMIKNEYMKLSRDATHRRRKGDKEAMVDAALEGSGDKKVSGG